MRRTPFDNRSPFGRIGKFYHPGGGYIITATIRPSGTLYDGENAADDLANFASYDSSGNYASSAGTIASVVYQVNEVTVATNTVLSVTDVPSWLVTDSEGNTRRFSIPAVQDIAPTQNAAPSASGDAVVGESLSGTSGTFNGTNLVESDEWEISDDGSTGWTGTGDTDTTGPAMVFGKHYRFASTATNSAGSLTTYSDVIGPVALPVLTINGLTSGDAVIGDEASITVTSDIGTITSTSWGTEGVEDQFGTGTNPTSMAGGDGDDLVVLAVIGGITYDKTAIIRYNAPVAADGLGSPSWQVGVPVSFDVSTDFTVTGDPSLIGVTFSMDPTSDTLPAGLSISPSGVITGTPTTEDATISLVVRGTNSGGNDTSTFTPTVTAASGAAVLTINSIGPQEASGNVPFTYTIDVTDTCQILLALAATAAPSAADFGSTSGGGANAGGYTALTATELNQSGAPVNVAMPTDLDDSYKLYFLPSGGGDSDIAASDAVTIDTTAAVLSSESFADDSGEGIDWAFTADENSAAVTGYRVSVWPDGTDPSDALIASGTGATATVTGTAAASVAETGNFAALGAGTYQPTIYYKDAFGNETFETYADVTVAAVGSSLTITFAKNGTYATVDGSTVNDSYDVGAAAAGKELWIVLTHGNSTGTTPPDMTIGGSPATLVSSRHTNVNTMCSIIRGDASAGGTISFSFTPVVPVQWRGLAWRVYVVEGRATELGDSDANTSYGAMDLSNNVLNGQHVLGVAGMANYGTTGTLTAVGLTEQITYTGLNGSKKSLFYDNAITATEAPRTMTLTPTGDGLSAVSSCIAILG